MRKKGIYPALIIILVIALCYCFANHVRAYYGLYSMGLYGLGGLYGMGFYRLSGLYDIGGFSGLYAMGGLYGLGSFNGFSATGNAYGGGALGEAFYGGLYGGLYGMMDFYGMYGGAGQLIHEVDFPAFVADLIRGVIQAIVDASIQQMQAYSELLQSVASQCH